MAMNTALADLYSTHRTDAPEHELLRLTFGLACVDRVKHLLEEPQAVDCLAVLQAYLQGRADRASLQRASEEISRIANGHRGSGSIDGSAHAAVSATYAVAKALQGRALDAAAYAAYASVYAYGGYAVNDPASFEDEFTWQAEKFRELTGVGGKAG
jgi:hypothetical protein